MPESKMQELKEGAGTMTRKAVRPCLFCDRLDSSRDHVMPEMFGKYESIGTTLTNFDVCGECNCIHFGQKLERSFGRNSAEAIFRLLFGLKSPDKAHEVGGPRVITTYLDNDEFRGVRIQLTSDGQGSMHAEMPPQVIIHHASLDVPRALLEEEITQTAIEPFLRGSTIWIPGDLDDKCLRLRAKMERAGFVFMGDVERVPISARPATDFLVRIDSVVDEVAARVVTKIAVDFLAVTTGYEFAMLPEFRPMRQFARYGEPNLRHRVETVMRSIEMDGTRDRYGDGHMITLDWSFATSEVIVLVSFFNRITYQVHLADDVKAVWRNIRTAYYFDIATRKAKRVEIGPGEHMTLVKTSAVTT